MVLKSVALMPSSVVHVKELKVFCPHQIMLNFLGVLHSVMLPITQGNVTD